MLFSATKTQNPRPYDSISPNFQGWFLPPEKPDFSYPILSKWSIIDMGEPFLLPNKVSEMQAFYWEDESN